MQMAQSTLSKLKEPSALFRLDLKSTSGEEVGPTINHSSHLFSTERPGGELGIWAGRTLQLLHKVRDDPGAIGQSRVR